MNSNKLDSVIKLKFLQKGIKYAVNKYNNYFFGSVAQLVRAHP